MTDNPVPASSTLRAKISTGYVRLDEALLGGFLAGSAVVLSAPASDEVPVLLRSFLNSTQDESLLVTRTLSSTETITQGNLGHVRTLVCSDKPVSPARNIISGKGIENLTELNFQISEAIGSTPPKRLVLDILSDCLLRHKALQTRRWLTELLEKMRSKGITTLAVLNPNMHPKEETEAILDLFDGNLEIAEKQDNGTISRVLRIKWMHGIDVPEKELQLADITPTTQFSESFTVSTPSPLREPRWSSPLVSRSMELSKLKAAFDDAVADKPSVVALRGEPGVGKTRLMQELAGYAQTKRANVLVGTAPEDALPYGPWTEVARQYVARVPGEVLRRMLGPYTSEFARLVPDIAAKLGTIPPSKPLGEQQDKIRLYETVTQFFIAISREEPLLLLFDDMQYVDQASLDLMEYFMRAIGGHPILLVSSSPSETEIEANSPLEQTFMKINKQRLLETVSVRNLDKEGTTALIKQIFGEQTVSPEFAQIIYESTGGNPFFIEEVLRSLVEDGTIFKTEKGWDRKPIQELVIPRTVKTALRSRLAKLGSDDLNILQWAAVVGGEFDFEVLQEVTQVNEDALVQKLESLISQALIVEVPHQKSKFRFQDNRLKELLLDDLIQIKRARYHLKVAEAMEKAYSKRLENESESIARHFVEGGDSERTIKYSIMAGDRNCAVHAYEQAINNYKRALELFDLETGREHEIAGLLDKLGAACYHAGKVKESTNCHERALGIYEKVNDRKGSARVCIGIANTLNRATLSSESTKMLMRGLEYLENELESYEAASIYSLLADYHSSFDNWDEGNKWADKALAVGEKTKNFRAYSIALQIKAAYLADTGRVDEALPLFERSLQAALEHDANDEAIFTLLNLSTYTYPRDLPKSLQQALRIIELGRRTGEIMGEARGWGFLSYLHWLRGDWNVAEEAFRNGKSITDRVDMKTTFLTDGFRILLLLSLGDLENADKYVQSALATAKEWPKISIIVLSRFAVGLLRVQQDNDDEALTHFETCVNTFRNWEFTTMPLIFIETLAHLARIYFAKEEFVKSRESVEWASRLATTIRSDAGMAMVLQAEGGLLLATGEMRQALEAFQKSNELWEKAAWPYYHAKALVAYSGALSKTSQAESKAKLEQAVQIFSRLGAKRDLERAQEKLRSFTV